MKTTREGLSYYQQLVDDLVERSEGVLANWVVGSGWPDTEDNRAINNFLKTLSREQKKILADMVMQARRGGMHDVLACLSEKMDMDEFRLSEKGVPLPLDPYGGGFHYAFISRLEGDAWPEDADLEATDA